MSDDTRSMEEIVAKYLRQNPEFLEREPALLKDLEPMYSSTMNEHKRTCLNLQKSLDSSE